MNYNLNDKVVVITGAGSGIGLASVKEFITLGAYVVGVDVEVSSLYTLGKRVLPIVADMCSTQDVEMVIDETIKKFGRIDILFNNVGIAIAKESFLEVTDEDWLKTINLNLLGYVRMTRAALPHMLARGEGVILHTASEAARMPNSMLPDYSVSKAAVAMLSKVLASEFTKKGIRSNTISPACIRTGIFDKKGGFGESLMEKYGVDKESAIQKFVEEMGIPLGRLGKPEEVAAMAVYLASDNARYVSGANFTLDGGLTPVL